MEFTWDSKKAEANKKKHGVSFEEAQTCFFDPLHLVIEDSCHSGEQRMVLIGLSAKNQTFVVVHVEFEDLELIRIISARKATKNEKKQYEEMP